MLHWLQLQTSSGKCGVVFSRKKVFLMDLMDVIDLRGEGAATAEDDYTCHFWPKFNLPLVPPT